MGRQQILMQKHVSVQSVECCGTHFAKHCTGSPPVYPISKKCSPIWGSWRDCETYRKCVYFAVDYAECCWYAAPLYNLAYIANPVSQRLTHILQNNAQKMFIKFREGLKRSRLLSYVAMVLLKEQTVKTTHLNHKNITTKFCNMLAHPRVIRQSLTRLCQDRQILPVFKTRWGQKKGGYHWWLLNTTLK